MTKALQIITCLCIVGYGLLYTEVQGHNNHGYKMPHHPYKYMPSRYYSKSMTSMAQENKKARCVGSFYCGLKKSGYNKIEECVSTAMICNGMKDCLSGADEHGCPPQCHNGILCNDKKTCGTPCDGKRDCPGGEDENCPNSCHCGEGTIKCMNEDLCIPTSKVCDGHKDCLMGNDEEDCSPACLCKEGSYLCEDGTTCITAARMCDGTNQCEGMDDESDCPATCFCPKGRYICQVFGEENPTCITQAQFCDNDNDCPREDDEDDTDHCGVIPQP